MSMKVQQIVRLRQMLRKWRRRSQQAGAKENRKQGGCSSIAPVPPGHVPVYVGEERVRFVVRTAQLHHAIFRALLRRSQQEFGFEQVGPLCIPCEAVFFEHLLSLLPSSAAAPPHLPDLLDFYHSSEPPSSASASSSSFITAFCRLTSASNSETQNTFDFVP
ncbi:hypothetical protein L7F22_023498 [Adiantum nelumboides]|nr:hypothetical protein [Adiantum nelumboides]